MFLELSCYKKRVYVIWFELGEMAISPNTKPMIYRNWDKNTSPVILGEKYQWIDI